MAIAGVPAADLDVVRLSGSLGAEVRGLRLAGADEATAERVEALLMEHMVLFFPEQHLEPAEQIAFAAHFGKPEGHPNVRGSSEKTEVFELRASQGAIADEWHSDLTCQDQPSVMAILNMVECPDVGGDTMWSNMVKAYEELSDPMKDLCEGLTALHDAHPHGMPDQMSIHPVVRVHPVTGRKSLFVNEHFTRRLVELSHEESEVVLRHLTRWVAKPNFTVRYQWRQGTIAIWDNRCTQHYVLDDFEGERVIQRVTIMGDEPESAAAPRWRAYTASGSPAAAGRHDRQLRAFLDERR
jgi:taurine dioxygenase